MNLKNNKTKKNKLNKNKTLKIRSYHDEFKPNLTPRKMFLLGSFGGTYWRPIYSNVTKKKYKNIHKKYPKSWWKGIREENLSSPIYDASKNKYGVKVGMSLEYWEEKNWMHPLNPYGWVHWYCDYCMGKRGPDDKRQISRWKGIAGKSGRFTRWLVTEIIKKNGEWNDETIGRKLRQILQHWGYKLTKKHYEQEINRRNEKK